VALICALAGCDDHSPPPDAGCDQPWLEQGADPFADEVVTFAPALPATFGADQLPDVVLGAPAGGGEHAGSLDVASLGCGGSITLRFDGDPIVDRPGPDLIVFENAFVAGSVLFAEPAAVSVSDDGESFVAFPCDPVTLAGCAGARPVLARPESCLDPTEPTVAGGDAFDLADVGLARASWVRLDDRSADHAVAAHWCDDDSAGFDLDAIAIVGD
jgi:hypothetical protein